MSLATNVFTSSSGDAFCGLYLCVSMAESLKDVISTPPIFQHLAEKSVAVGCGIEHDIEIVLQVCHHDIEAFERPVRTWVLAEDIVKSLLRQAIVQCKLF